MKRLVLLLLLVLAATVAHGADDDWSPFAQTQFDEWFATNYPAQRRWPCCEGIRWATFVDRQQDYFEDAQRAYAYDLMSHEYRDRAGLKRDTYYFLGYQLVSIGILYILPENMSGWSDEQKEEYSLSRWWYNVRHPTWDSDDFFINYVTHPYWGAAYFVRARERGYTSGESFWYSAMLSAMYEFGAEALFEQPSIQDLIVTPVLGSLLGRYFMGVRENTEIGAIERGYRDYERQMDPGAHRSAGLHQRVYRQMARPGRRPAIASIYESEPANSRCALQAASVGERHGIRAGIFTQVVNPGQCGKSDNEPCRRTVSRHHWRQTRQ